MTADTSTRKPRLLSTDEAAHQLGLKRQTLAVWRCTNRVALPYIKVGSRVRYRQCDIDAYLAKHTSFPTEFDS